MNTPCRRRVAACLLLFLSSCGGSQPSTDATGDDDTGGTGGDVGTGGSTGPQDGGKGGAAGAKDAGKGGAAGAKAGGSGTGGAAGSGGGATLPSTVDCTGSPVATAPAGTWVDATGNLDCSNVDLMVAQPCSNMVVAGLWKAGLWATQDAGKSWTHLGDTGGQVIDDGVTDTILNGPTEILFDPKTPTTFWESGMYGWQSPWTKGAFVTHDNGVTFQGFTNMGAEMQSHNDSISVDFTDPSRNTILSGGHEQKVTGGQGLFLSTDQGANFDDIMTRLPTDVGFCTLALVLDSQNMLVGCPASWSGNPGAIVRSGDGGTTWTKVYTSGVSTAWGAHPLWAKDGTIYWPAENSGLLKSADQGKTWSVISGASNIKQAPLELPDGRILSATSSQIVVTADGGNTWTPVGPALPQEGGFAYSIMAKTLFVWKGGCKTAGWDYTK